MAESNFEEIVTAVRQLPMNQQAQLRVMLEQQFAEDVRLEQSSSVKLPALGMIDRSRETQWLREHRHEYAGQWLALDGVRLLAHSFDADEVFAAADAAGIARPYLVHLEAADELLYLRTDAEAIDFKKKKSRSRSSATSHGCVGGRGIPR